MLEYQKPISQFEKNHLFNFGIGSIVPNEITSLQEQVRKSILSGGESYQKCLRRKKYNSAKCENNEFTINMENYVPLEVTPV
ncbi:hypothetical protein CEXT_507011 [Caerostris extrusa]|uniref:Uncharacterized protein n=1 Tax=Caerostris extrusa TaxID=172846 RepID=A0AAV4XBK1_CAEEX|nr:hypothetical protein CEXT_507011 [Caerostris extrusa]